MRKICFSMFFMTKNKAFECTIKRKQLFIWNEMNWNDKHGKHPRGVSEHKWSVPLFAVVLFIIIANTATPSCHLLLHAFDIFQTKKIKILKILWQLADHWELSDVFTSFTCKSIVTNIFPRMYAISCQCGVKIIYW